MQGTISSKDKVRCVPLGAEVPAGANLDCGPTPLALPSYHPDRIAPQAKDSCYPSVSKDKLEDNTILSCLVLAVSYHPSFRDTEDGEEVEGDRNVC